MRKLENVEKDGDEEKEGDNGTEDVIQVETCLTLLVEPVKGRKSLNRQLSEFKQYLLLSCDVSEW